MWFSRFIFTVALMAISCFLLIYWSCISVNACPRLGSTTYGRSVLGPAYHPSWGMDHMELRQLTYSRVRKSRRSALTQSGASSCIQWPVLRDAHSATGRPQMHSLL